jgi:hypothetical protein
VFGPGCAEPSGLPNGPAGYSTGPQAGLLNAWSFLRSAPKVLSVNQELIRRPKYCSNSSPRSRANYRVTAAKSGKTSPQNLGHIKVPAFAGAVHSRYCLHRYQSPAQRTAVTSTDQRISAAAVRLFTEKGTTQVTISEPAPSTGATDARVV